MKRLISSLTVLAFFLFLLVPLEAQTLIEEIPFSKGKIRIRYEYILENGKKIPEGFFKEFYANGKLYKFFHYKKGLLNGKASEYYPDEKKKWEGTFTNNIKTGTWTFWAPAGSKLLEGEFAPQGQLLSITRYNKKSHTYVKETFKDGNPSGIKKGHAWGQFFSDSSSDSQEIQDNPIDPHSFPNFPEAKNSGSDAANDSGK
jgi:hypothetical protein